MAYSKKTEPLTTFEAMMAGVTLFLWVVMGWIVPYANNSLECDKSFLTTDVSIEDDVYTFHDCIKKDRSIYLFGATILLLSYPFILAHIHYMHRSLQTVLFFANLDLWQCLYLGSWFISSIVYCIIYPAFIILIVYYDWKFADGHEYTGYAMQFQLFQLMFTIVDCVIIPFGITAFLPWYAFATGVLGYNKSAYWEISHDGIIGTMYTCPKISKISVLLICIIMGSIVLFGSFADVFDYDKNGFFSRHGDSQYVGFVILISWIVFALMCIHNGFILNDLEKYVNENIKAVPLSKRENENKDDDDNTNTPVPVVPETEVDVTPHDQDEQDNGDNARQQE